MNEKKGNAIYFWRIIFTYMIVIFHFDNPFPYSAELGIRPGGYIAVEFFFIVSGYLLFEKSEQYKQRFPSAWQYTLHRYRQIYFKYLFAFVLVFCAIVQVRNLNLAETADLLLDSYWEIFALQGIGLGREWNYINPTLWYISILFIGGYIIYFFLLHYRDVFLKIIAPVFIMVAYSLLYRNVGSLDAVVRIEGIYLHYALIRGLADMCLGIYGVMINNYLQENYKGKKGIRILGVFLLLAVIFLALAKGHSTIDFLLAFMIMFGVAIAFLPTDYPLLSGKLVRCWSGLSLSIYLIHELFRSYVFPYSFTGSYRLGQKFQILVVYLLATSIGAIVFELIYQKLLCGLWEKIISVSKENI